MQQNTRSDKEVLIPGASRLGKRRLKSSGVSTSHLWEIVWTSFSSTWVERYNDCCKRRKGVFYWVRRMLKSASRFFLRSPFLQYGEWKYFNPFLFFLFRKGWFLFLLFPNLQLLHFSSDVPTPSSQYYRILDCTYSRTFLFSETTWQRREQDLHEDL